jgi:hypothetical protein
MKKVKLNENDIERLVVKIIKEEGEIDLDNYEAPFTAQEFTNWVDSEWDTEMLQFAMSKIQERLGFLNHLHSTASRGDRVGFRRSDEEA